jgi:hypothetical protein
MTNENIGLNTLNTPNVNTTMPMALVESENKSLLRKNASLSMVKLLRKVCLISPSSLGPAVQGSINSSNLYNYNKTNQYKNIQLLNYITNILNHFFGTFFAIINKPVFSFTQNKLTISIDYFMPKASSKLVTRHVWKYGRKPARKASSLNTELNQLVKVISRLLNLKIELKLNQLKYPYMDSYILAKFIALNTNKTRFRTIFWRVIDNSLTAKISPKSLWYQMWKNNDSTVGSEQANSNSSFLTLKSDQKSVEIHKSNPAILTGIKVQISGRLLTERVKPKLTINQKEMGGFKKTHNNIVDYAVYTNKNKRGAYTVKVWTTSTIIN